MGKTTVLHFFGQAGAHTLNIDELVHDILNKPSIIRKITKLLGESVLDSKTANLSINKKRVARIIFNDPAKRRAVEELIHPEVLKSMKRAERRILRNNQSAIIVCEVPLLFEAGYEDIFDKLIVVFCSRKTAVARLIVKGFSKDEALKRMRAQLPITKKKKMADYVINNNHDVQGTEKQVKRIFDKITRKSNIAAA